MIRVICKIGCLVSCAFMLIVSVNSQEVATLKKDENLNTVKLEVETKPLDTPGYQLMKGTASYQGKSFPVAFKVFIQKEYFTTKERLPAIITLHNIANDCRGADGNPIMHSEAFGALMSSDIGSDSRHVGEWPAVKFNPSKEAKFIGILPQCAKDYRFEQMPMCGVVIEMINWVEKNYRVDPDRCYLTGYSYGGMCTWALAMAYPERFAAIVPLSGRLPATPELAPEKLKDLGVWCGVGENDGDFKAGCVRMNDILVAAKHPNFHFAIIKGGSHFCFQSIYGDAEFWKWLLDQKRKPKTDEVKRTENVPWK